MADRLPFHILANIFSAARISTYQPDVHGGTLTSWISHEAVKPFALVCSAWTDAANFVLYRSVAIMGRNSPTLFLRTLEEDPRRALLVRSLVVGLEQDGNATLDDAGREEEAQTLLKVLEMCTEVDTLHVRPFPPSFRTPLLAAITSKRLDTLVCAPRLHTPNSTLYHGSDLQLLCGAARKHLELDFWIVPPTSREFSLPQRQPLTLTHLALSCSNEPHDLMRIIKSAATLVALNVYIEAVCDPAALADALVPSAKTLRRISFISNPPVENIPGGIISLMPTFDRILPSFLQLEHLSTSATEISPSALRRLPPTLSHLEVDSVAHSPHFLSPDALLEVLSDLSITFSLATLVLHSESWLDDAREAVREACAKRDIVFLLEQS
ncbi:hypothetical protein RQP46_005754 [Phenoliferia psychrophenolica]